MRTSIKHIGQQSPIFDLEAEDLPQDLVSYANNYVLRNNKYISFNGENLLSSTTTFNGGYVDFIQTTNNSYYLVAGRTAVKVFDGSSWSDISNIAGYAFSAGDELLWSGCKLGLIPIITNPQGFPEYWAPQSTATKMQDLKFDAATTWRSKGYRCKIIRAHKTFLFALNLTEGGNEFPNAYRWSHPADIGGLPFSWDPLDISTIASREMLGDESIVDGLSLRDNFIIYTNRGIHSLSFVGGEFVFNAEQISKTHYLLTANCVVEAVGSHYFLSNGDILINDGTNIVSVLDEKVKQYLQNTLSVANFNNCFAQLNPNTKEVWFFIVQEGFTYPNIAVIINYVKNNNISIRDIAGSKVSATFGASTIVSDAWSSDSITWDQNNAPWGQSSSSSPFGYSLVALDGPLLQLQNQEPKNFLTPFNTQIMRSQLVLEGVDKETLSTVTRVIPHIRSSGPVLVELGSQDSAQAGIRWKPGVVYNTNTDRKVDTRTTGMFHCWRISSIGATYFELSGIDFEYEIVGGRVGGFIPVVAR
jgi:hypothetical protein